MSNTDSQWERFGAVDPYFGVLSHARFHKEKLTEDTRAEFFRSGEDHVQAVFSAIHSKLDAEFSPLRTLDFGCGVGRLLPALAKRSREVVGYDISSGMIAEAEKNVKLPNVTTTMLLDGTFDFLHSFIVFQHIEPKRGARILANLVDRLHGVGAIQFTYHSRHSLLGKVGRILRRAPILNGIYNLTQRRSFRYPWMRVSEYSLNSVFNILRSKGCYDFSLIPSDQGKVDGCMFLFKRD